VGVSVSVSVWLVGAGPGDPELLTVKAARLLAGADVVVHDALVGDGVLALVPPTAELIDVGKRPGRPVPQELISTLLVTLARDGKRVVRLKGGDPFVFGRGGEEAEALVAAGIPFEVVPGITSAVAAPAAAGVPVTHRGVAASFTVVTGHRRAGEQDIDWRALARVSGTVVVLMGVSQRATIAAELLAGGLDPATPVAAVRSARCGAASTSSPTPMCARRPCSSSVPSPRSTSPRPPPPPSPDPAEGPSLVRRPRPDDRVGRRHRPGQGVLAQRPPCRGGLGAHRFQAPSPVASGPPQTPPQITGRRRLRVEAVDEKP
jgi:uroporphyrin-III C-methyltransferase